MKFEGQNNIRVSPNGDLVFETSVGDVSHTKLYAYQEINGTQKQIDCKFIDKGNGIIAFNLSNYDPSKALIIDPTVSYVTYFGRTSTDYAYAINIDPNGNAIISGYTYSTNMPVTPGAYQSSIPYSYTGFVTKMNATGNGLVFCTYLGGTNSYTYIYGCGTDQYSNTYVCGYTGASNFPVTNAFQSSIGGGADGFVSKLNTNGSSLIYSSFIGGSSTEYSYAMAVDPDGYAYITGYTSSSNFPTTSGAKQTSMASSPDAYVVKVGPTGSRVYSTYLGGTGGEYGYGIAADNSGNAYVTGYTYSSNFPTTTGAYQTTYGYYDPYITKVSPTGNAWVYSTYIPGNINSDYAYGICVNSNGEAAITGYCYSSNFPTTPGAIQTTISTTPDAFVLKMNAAGNGLIFSTFLGGNNTDYGRGIACDATGNIYVGGYDYSTNFVGITPDGYRTTLSTTPDAFMTAFSPTGAKLYGTFLGGSSSDLGYYFQCIGANANSEVAVGGYTSSTNFPVTSGCYQSTLSSSPDAWVAKFVFEPPLDMSTGDPFPTQFCKGDNLTVSYNVTKGTPKAGNNFSIELSDEFGNFGSPRVIGQISSQALSGIISCTLPSTALPPASLYKVRVRSSAPAFVAAPSATTLTVNPPPIGFNMTGINGFCANSKEGPEIGIDGSEKYTYYQLFVDGVKIGSLVEGTGQPLSFGRYKTIGKYTADAISPFGCKNVMNGLVDVAVIPLPVVYNMTGGGQYFDQPGPGTYCEGGDGIAIGLSNGEVGVKYQLKLNGKDISIPIDGRGDKISFGYFTEPGTYNIEALSIKGGCLSNMSGNIVVKMLPAPKVFDLQSTGTYCEGGDGVEVKLSGSEAGFVYQLFFNNKAQGNPITGNGSALNFGKYNVAGAYHVVATNSTIGCTKVMNGTVTLSPVPSPKVYHVTGIGSFCQGAEGAVIVLSGSSTDVVYELFVNGTTTGTKLVGTGAELTFLPVKTNGKYTIIGTTVAGSCTVEMQGAVNVAEIPLPSVNIVGNKTPAMTSTEKYTVENPQEKETYLWKVTNGTIVGSNTGAEITVKWEDRSTGTIELFRKNSFGCSNWATVNISLTNVLSAEFVAKQSKGDVPFLVEFTSTTTGLVSSYLWEFGDGGTSPQPNPSHTYKQVGKYTVKLTVTHDGNSKTVSKADFVTVLPANSVEEDGESYNANKTAGISLIEPNPAKNEIRFEYYLTVPQNIELSVYDALGNRIMTIASGMTSEGRQNMNVDVTNLTSGNYYLQMNTKDGNVTKHFSIVK
jgi:PKD repeat protein